MKLKEALNFWNVDEIDQDVARALAKALIDIVREHELDPIEFVALVSAAQLAVLDVMVDRSDS